MKNGTICTMVKILQKFFFVFLCALLYLQNIHVAHAQNNSGITIIPAFVEESANPGDVFARTLKVTNESDVEKEFFIYKRNIKGVETGGVPVFDDEGGEVTGYEITEWISLPYEKIVIPAFGSTELEFTVTVPTEATPGSHFGGIFVSLEPPKLRVIGAGVGYEVASIVSIKINGDVIDTARIRSLSSDKLIYSSKDVIFDARVENQGNILIRPRGVITIKSMFGGEPASVSVNESLAGVFPGTLRDFQFTWNGKGIGFGRYEAILALGYEGKDGQKTIDATHVFWIFPTKIMVTILSVFVLLFFAGYFLTKYYINQAIMRAAGGRNIPPQRYRRQVGISRFAFITISLMTLFVLFLIVVFVFFA